MFKLFISICMVLSAIFGSSCASAAAGDVVIAEIQMGGTASGTTAEEYISIYNNSSSDIDVTNWCLQYAVYSKLDFTSATTIGCIISPNNSVRLMLPAQGYVVAMSHELTTKQPVGYMKDISFAGGILSGSSTGGTIRLIDASGMEIDKVGYGASAKPETSPALFTPNNVTNRSIQRLGTALKQDTDNNLLDFTQFPITIYQQSAVYEQAVITDQCPNTPQIDVNVPVGYMKDIDGNCYEDVCDNIGGLQKAVPAGYATAGFECEIVRLQLSELLPNVASTDTGKEYIELYNPTSTSVDTAGYSVQLGSKIVKLTSFMLSPLSYVAFSDAETGLTLLNTEATVTLLDPEAAALDSTSYVSPLDDHAWALIDGVWQYTDQPTRAAVNLPMTPAQSEGETTSDVVTAACPAGKYRNPLTGRCKNIEANELTPCAADQERNPETNRCRSIFASTAGLTSCKAGQERNPETNRCRNVASAASAALKPCPANQERNPETNRCRKVVSVPDMSAIKDQEAPQHATGSGWWIAALSVFGFGGYAAWEWRAEVLQAMRKVLAMK